jgi:rhamnose transport system ATP-binding protein
MAGAGHLELVDIAKAYGGSQALKGVSLHLRRGEIHALLGTNGAGKSTLIKVLAGAVRPDRGVVRRDGAELALRSPARAHAQGLSVVHQELTLFPDLAVWRNIVAGKLPRRTAAVVDVSAGRRLASEALARLGASIPLNARTGDRPLAQRQLVEIARALHSGGDVLVLDEPTSALPDAEAERLLDVIRSLKNSGHIVLLVSHRLDEVYAVADWITVLRDGEVAASASPHDLPVEEAIAAMVGSTSAVARSNRERGVAAQPLIELADDRGMELTLRAGEIVGLAGLEGAGHTDVLRGLGGIGNARLRVSIEGRERAIRKPINAIRLGIVYVPPDRKLDGLWLDRSVTANIAAGRLPAVSRLGTQSARRSRAFARSWVDRFGIRTTTVDAPARALSGGNQQRVMLARSLAMEPRCLLLTEPTRGVDVAAKADIHRRLRDVSDTGMAICFTSSEVPELLEVADRIVCFRGGAIVAEGPVGEFDEPQVLALIGGGR